VHTLDNILMISLGCSRTGCGGKYLSLWRASNRGVEKSAKFLASCYVLLKKYYLGDQVKKKWAGHVARVAKT
jgi:hypothetical protein